MIALSFGFLLSAAMSGHAYAASSPQHTLTIDDVLDTVMAEQASASPDGQAVAVTLQRPARTGETFGRNAYEIDPGRNDIWLVSRSDGSRQNLTEGATLGAGFWCPGWSPDSEKLAMLSTKPEGGEPKGGSGVHLYVWDRKTQASRRIIEAPMMVQVRYGSGMDAIDLRGGADSGTAQHRCMKEAENSPFIWLDKRRILAITLADGQVSAMIDQFDHASAHTAETRNTLRAGGVATVSAMNSGTGAAKREGGSEAILQIIDTETGSAKVITRLPIYRFQGTLALAVSHDLTKVAIMTATGVITPNRGQKIPHHVDDWQVEKKVGVLALSPMANIAWLQMPDEGRYPLELLGWSPDSTRFALRARGFAESPNAGLYVASTTKMSISHISAEILVGDVSADWWPHVPAATWINNDQLLVTGKRVEGKRSDWWLVGVELH
jgi:hypothetical protein